MSKILPTQNPGELDIIRNETIQKMPGFTMVFNGTTSQQTTSMAHHGGANLTWSMQSTSEFNPNNRQTLTQGDLFSDTKGNAIHVSRKNLDLRAFGDISLISGDPNFFNSPIASQYIKHRSEIASAQTAPEMTVGGTGNNSKTQYEQQGTPNEETGSTQGGSFQPNPAKQNISQLVQQKQKEMTPIEQAMGVGGSIRFMSCKNLHFQAGTVPTTFDSAFINSIGRAVPKETTTTTKKKKYDVEYKQVQTAVPQCEVKNTAGNMPFGDLSIVGNNSVSITGGAGGMTLMSGGAMKFGGSSVTSIFGYQVIVGGNTAIRGQHIELNAYSQLNTQAPTTHMDTKLTVTKDTVIEGNLIVKGNITVSGNIYCNGEVIINKNVTVDEGSVKVVKGRIDAKDEIASEKEVRAKNIKLTKHKHKEQGDGNLTSPSKP